MIKSKRNSKIPVLQSWCNWGIRSEYVIENYEIFNSYRLDMDKWIIDISLFELNILQEIK